MLLTFRQTGGNALHALYFIKCSLWDLSTVKPRTRLDKSIRQPGLSLPLTKRTKLITSHSRRITPFNIAPTII